MIIGLRDWTHKVGYCVQYTSPQIHLSARAPCTAGLSLAYINADFGGLRSITEDIWTVDSFASQGSSPWAPNVQFTTRGILPYLEYDFTHIRPLGRGYVAIYHAVAQTL